MSRNNIFGYSSLKSALNDCPFFHHWSTPERNVQEYPVKWIGLVRRWNIACPDDFPFFPNRFSFRGRFRPAEWYKAVVSATSTFLPLPFHPLLPITITLMFLEHTRQYIDPEYIE